MCVDIARLSELFIPSFSMQLWKYISFIWRSLWSTFLKRGTSYSALFSIKGSVGFWDNCGVNDVQRLYRFEDIRYENNITRKHTDTDVPNLYTLRIKCCMRELIKKHRHSRHTRLGIGILHDNRGWKDMQLLWKLYSCSLQGKTFRGH
jgi:hypothetical protein